MRHYWHQVATQWQNSPHYLQQRDLLSGRKIPLVLDDPASGSGVKSHSIGTTTLNMAASVPLEDIGMYDSEEEEDSDPSDHEDTHIPIGFLPILRLLETVAAKRGLVGDELNTWARTTWMHLHDISVTTMRDVLRQPLSINMLLRHVGHETIDKDTITLMLHEITDLLWPDSSSSSESMIEEDVAEELDEELEEED
jgi:hypothetical protein